MKTFINILLVTLLISSMCMAQITEDYPFKTYLDSENNLYVAGYSQGEITKDIYIAKYPNDTATNPTWSYTYFNHNGDDRGLDIAVDNLGNTFVTGYSFNNITNSNDIIVIALHPDGIFHWSSTYNNAGDDKGMAIDIVKNGQGIAIEVFITGYISNPLTGKDFIIKKYNPSNGSSPWQYINKSNPGDDVATDILLDDNFAYVLGYSYFNSNYLNDIVLQTYDLSDESLQEYLVDHRAFSDEKPTAFLIAAYSPGARIKSRIAVTSVTDNSSTGNGGSFTTMYLEPNHNNYFNIRWRDEYPCSSREAVTSITADRRGDVYVTGYLKNDRELFNYGYDFATIKYRSITGGYGWHDKVKLYNHFDSLNSTIDDKASSIKVNSNDIIFVSGTSDPTPMGFSIVSYLPTTPDPQIYYSRKFVPNFERDIIPAGRLMNKWTTLHLTSNGDPLMVVMSWDETQANWAAIRYDANGNVLYTINNNPGDLNREPVSNNENTLSLTNYPNPFNPSTVISYSLIENGFVSLKVYNALGKEVASLVNEKKNSGNHSTVFNAGNLSSGVYYYTMTVNGLVNQTMRMILLK